jgi:hypothetical protein
MVFPVEEPGSDETMLITVWFEDRLTGEAEPRRATYALAAVASGSRTRYQVA